jgi:peptidoglycan hydrolase-like protein with peptidoglycan-binding domain
MVTIAAVGAAAFAAIPAGAALADGPNTPPSVVRHIQAETWPVLQRGDDSQTVRAVQYLLRGYKLAPGAVSARYAIPTDGNFEAVTEKAVTSFQGWRDLTESGKVDAATWNSFSGDLKSKPIGQGNTNAEHVKAMQVLLNLSTAKCGYKALAVDGQFGAGTKSATVKFQKCQKLDADGLVGPLTFKALVPDA